MRQLAEWRRRAGLTQVQLAELVDCDQSTISAIERGGAPSVRLLGLLATVLNVQPDELADAVRGVESAPELGAQ